jgi:membrane associated rhomboid family serine protease
MLPLGDMTPLRRPPFVTIGLAAVTCLVWLAYQLPAGVDRSVQRIGFTPCGVDGSCRDSGLPWPAEVLTSMFGHASWAHLVGNMVFLLALGSLVEGVMGHVRYLALYLVSGIAAGAAYGAVMLLASHHEASVTVIGASGAISGVLGAYVVARPFTRVLVWVAPIFFLRIPAVAVIGMWFILQAVEGSLAISSPQHSSIAFVAHVGGFLAGLIMATALLPGSWPHRASRALKRSAPQRA